MTGDDLKKLIKAQSVVIVDLTLNPTFEACIAVRGHAFCEDLKPDRTRLSTINASPTLLDQSIDEAINNQLSAVAAAAVPVAASSGEKVFLSLDFRNVGRRQSVRRFFLDVFASLVQLIVASSAARYLADACDPAAGWDRGTVFISYASPRILAIQARAGETVFTLVSGHCPTSAAPAADRKAWWAALLFLDANAHFDLREGRVRYQCQCTLRTSTCNARVRLRRMGAFGLLGRPRPDRELQRVV